jgi:hypothetical protein
MGIKRWWQSRDPNERGSWIQSFGVVIAGGIGAVGAIAAVVVAFVMSNHSPTSPQPGPSHTPTTSITTDPPTSSVIPLSFYEPHDRDKEGLVVRVTLTGTVPPGEHLWIFVCHHGDCYAQGMPTQEASNIWSLGTVNLGSDLPNDIKSWYDVYAVLADSQANRAIQAKFKSTDYGNNGMSAIPGGSEAKKIAQISLYRNR